MKMLHLTESQIEAIELLAIYKYLTNALKLLLDMKRPLVAKHDFNLINWTTGKFLLFNQQW